MKNREHTHTRYTVELTATGALDAHQFRCFVLRFESKHFYSFSIDAHTHTRARCLYVFIRSQQQQWQILIKTFWIVWRIDLPCRVGGAQMTNDIIHCVNWGTYMRRVQKKFENSNKNWILKMAQCEMRTPVSRIHSNNLNFDVCTQRELSYDRSNMCGNFPSFLFPLSRNPYTN